MFVCFTNSVSRWEPTSILQGIWYWTYQLDYLPSLSDKLVLVDILFLVHFILPILAMVIFHTCLGAVGGGKVSLLAKIIQIPH